MHNKIQVALDFDDTYTRDPATWQNIVSTMKDAGWEVRFVTFRDDHEDGRYNNTDIKTAASVMDIPIIFTAGKQKQPACQAIGFNPSFWIDDLPYLIPSCVNLAGMVYGCIIKNNDITGEEL